MSGGQRLRALLVSDLHCHYEHERALAAWLEAHPDVGSVDLIIASGDLATMQPEDNGCAEKVQQCEQDIVQVLENVEIMRSLLLARQEQAGDDLVPIYWIPGNHDAVTTFSDGLAPMTPHSTNFHNAFVPLASGLTLCGFGGSVPAYQAGKQRWTGYPFSDNESMAAPLQELLPAGDATGQLLLVTHVGPSSSATAVDQVNLAAPSISTGSTALDVLVRRADMQERVVANVHGHTHYAPGMARVGRVPVINPGALLFGQFGLLELVQKKGRWEVAEVRFFTL